MTDVKTLDKFNEKLWEERLGGVLDMFPRELRGLTSKYLLWEPRFQNEVGWRIRKGAESFGYGQLTSGRKTLAWCKGNHEMNCGDFRPKLNESWKLTVTTNHDDNDINDTESWNIKIFDTITGTEDQDVMLAEQYSGDVDHVSDHGEIFAVWKENTTSEKKTVPLSTYMSTKMVLSFDPLRAPRPQAQKRRDLPNASSSRENPKVLRSQAVTSEWR
jgi:hypothetical protein